jgi:hypothetical protein
MNHLSKGSLGFKKLNKARRQWLTSEIPAIQKAEIRKTVV